MREEIPALRSVAQNVRGVTAIEFAKWQKLFKQTIRSLERFWMVKRYVTLRNVLCYWTQGSSLIYNM